MKLTLLAFICFGIAYVTGQCNQDGKFAEGCWDEPNLAKIECVNGVNDCTCEPGSVDSACDSVTVTVADMNGQTCKDICTELEGCVFYRWEMDSDQHCSLMSEDQCKSYEPCPVGKCISGQKECETGDIPDPVGKPCNSHAKFIHGNIHWKCINPFDDNQDRIDIYEDAGKTIPYGTICYTDRKCKAFDTDEEDTKENPDFLYHTIVVQCGVSSPEMWGKYEQSTNDITLGVDTDSYLQDPACPKDLDDLLLDKAKLTESGVSFICSDGDKLDWTDEAVVRVINPNTCALLCNFHQTMTIEPKFDEKEGIYQWWLYPTGEGTGQEATKDNVHCWAAL